MKINHLHCKARSAEQVSGTPALIGDARENKNALATTLVFILVDMETRADHAEHVEILWM